MTSRWPDIPANVRAVDTAPRDGTHVFIFEGGINNRGEAWGPSVCRSRYPLWWVVGDFVPDYVLDGDTEGANGCGIPDEHILGWLPIECEEELIAAGLWSREAV